MTQQDLIALGIYHLERRGMDGDPAAAALFVYVRELEAERADAQLAQNGPGEITMPKGRIIGRGTITITAVDP